MNKKKEIVKTWLAGQYSCTLIIPKEFAKDEGQVFISVDKLNEMIQREVDKRFGKKEVDI